MATFGEAFLLDLAKAMETLHLLTHNPYDSGDVRDVLSTVGAKSELFMRSVLLPSESSKRTSEYLIDALPITWVSPVQRDALHRLRKLYNNAKHDPGFQIDILDALDVISQAATAYQHIIGQKVGLTLDERLSDLRRVYWISASDHYTGGETEVHIHIPGKSKHWLGVPSFDMVNIAGADWDDLKAELAAVGVLREAKGLIPDEQIKAFTSDAHSLSPLVFEGYYHDLLIILCSYECRLEILPFLRRDYDEQNTIIAVLIAACGVIIHTAEISDLPALIEKQAVSQYGVTTNYQDLKRLVREFADMFALVPAPEWPKVRGPNWVRKEAFAKRSGTVRTRHTRYPIVITDDFLVLMFWDHE